MTRKSSAYIGWTQSRLQKLCENEKKIPKPIDIFHVLGYNTPCQSNGLSPNGKATDSDSVIFKVRILVAQF